MAYKKVRALVIEEDSALARQLEEFLHERFSIDVQVAGDASAARAKLVKYDFDMITLDCRTPDAPGTSLLGEITSREDHPPVIILTGRPDEKSGVESVKSLLEELVSERTTELEQARVRLELEVSERSRRERKQAAEAAYFRSLFENSMDVIAVFDEKALLLDVSPSVREVLGHEPEEVIGTSILDVIHPDDLPLLIETHKRAIREGGTPSSVEVRMRHTSGDWRVVEAVGSSYTDPEGCTRVVVNARDITRYITERDETMKFKTIADTANYGVAILNLDRMIVYSNPYFSSVHGYEPEELIGESFEKYHNTDQFDRIYELSARIEKGGFSAEEVWHAHRDGSVFPMLMSGVLISDATGAPRFFATTALDISDIKRTEEEMLRLNSELDGYAQTVSHGLRTPLTAIKMAADTLQRIWARRDDIGDIEAEIARICEVIQMGAGKAERLIDDLLSLARAGQESAVVESVNVRDVVDEVLEENELLIAAKGVSFELDDELGTLVADRTHIYQLFSNLVGNAIKFDDSADPWISVSHSSDDGFHLFEVRDNSSGIPEKILPTIFLPFVKGVVGDTGVGLAIVQKLVDLYGGCVTARNENGAVFTFSILDRPPAAAEDGRG